jgi:hypothetical protein
VDHVLAKKVRSKGPKVIEEGLRILDIMIGEMESPDKLIISPFKLKTDSAGGSNDLY